MMKNTCLLLIAAILFFSTFSFASIQIDIPGPPDSVEFGAVVKVLPNGNIVVKDDGFFPPGASIGAQSAGAVHLLDGRTGQIISTLIGNQAEDDVGRDIYVLPNGDFVVATDTWANGAMLQVGALTHCSGTTGCSGTINSSNSLIGTTADDRVGLQVYILPNSNYVTLTRYWHEVTSAKAGGGTPGVGAVTFCNGSIGCSGVVSSANSVIGTSLDDFLDGGIEILSDGDFLIRAPGWDSATAGNVGAVRKCSGTTGCTGPITAANALVGETAGDFVGGAVDLLSGGIYAVRSGSFDLETGSLGPPLLTNAGAVTFCTSPAGCVGNITTANSLVGASANDRVGDREVKVLPNGKVVVASSQWDNGGIQNAGAVTFCQSVTQCTGPVTTANSLHGTNNFDNVGDRVPLVVGNGNYVIRSPIWNNGTGFFLGAVTFCDGTTGCIGPVTTANSLYGSGSDDQVGFDGFVLPNGNYVLENENWDDGANLNVGAVTFCSGSTGCVGEVSSSNSLIGPRPGDRLGNFGTVILANGNFVVSTWFAGENDEGAVTFCSGMSGCPVGPATPANSLFGVNSGDRLGSGGILTPDNGNYVVLSPDWDNPVGAVRLGPPADHGAATLCSGTTGCIGSVSEANSLVGNNGADRVGSRGLALGSNYVVGSPNWGGFPVKANAGPADPDFGAVTFCDGVNGCTGGITIENSLVGETSTTRLGIDGLEKLSNGDYIVISGGNDLFSVGGGGDVPGSITYCDGFNGTFGLPEPQNTIFSIASRLEWVFDPVNAQLVAGRPGDNVVTLFRNTVSQPAPYDFDGDGRTDVSVFRPSDGNWYVNRSTDGFFAVHWGQNGDVLAPADYDGDGKTDIAVWRAGPPTQARFYILNSNDFSLTERALGQTGDIPSVVGDWDGDGKADPAVYRDSAAGPNSRFYYLASDNNPGNNITFLNWGTTGDKPVRGDYDGDGILDVAVFRPSTATWWIRKSSDASVMATNWGLSSDRLIPGDYDGDGKTDLAVFRPSENNWYYLRSSNLEPIKFQWGQAGDLLAPGDFDGDGRIDPTVFRPLDQTWYTSQSGSGSPAYSVFGLGSDLPVPSTGVTN